MEPIPATGNWTRWVERRKDASGGADRWRLSQPFGDAVAHIQAALLVVDACEQVGGLQRDQCRGLFDVGGQACLVQSLAALERLRRRSDDLNLTAQLATIPTELEQTRPATSTNPRLGKECVSQGTSR